MNLFMFLMGFRLLDAAGSDAGGAGGGAGTADPAAAASAAAVDPAAAGSATDPAAAAVATDPAAAAVVDPNDPMAALEAAMAAELGADPAAAVDPAAAAADPAAIAPEFKEVLSISDFVKAPEHVAAAVAAADEVWKVASGQLPGRALLEGILKTNPQQGQAIVSDLAAFISEVTGQQFGGAAQPGPLDALKAANPQAYQQIAQLFQQATGQPLDGAADPRDARLSAIEQRFQNEEQQRQEQAIATQISTARTKATEIAKTALAGTFAEGMESRYVGDNGLCWAKAQAMGIQPKQMMEDLLSGKPERFEKVLKAVKADEAQIIKSYNANLIKKHRTLASGVPAVKGAMAVKADNAALAAKPGETAVQHAERLWKNNLV